MKNSLIEKLEALKITGTYCLSNHTIQTANWMLDMCVGIVRQHQAEQPQDVVDRVAKAIYETSTKGERPIKWDEAYSKMRNNAIRKAKAAIAAMGDASTRKDEGRIGITAQIATSANPVSASPAQLTCSGYSVMGEPSIGSNPTPKDAETLGVEGAPTPSPAISDEPGPLYDYTREICDTKDELLDHLCREFSGKKLGHDFGFRQIIEALAPFLRSPVPVMSEFETWILSLPHTTGALISIKSEAKRRLDAAGVKYVD